MVTIDLKAELASYPVVTTGMRWPLRHEGEGERSPAHDLFGNWPHLRGDPRYADYGRCPDSPDNPRPGSAGGGLFPVLTRTPNGNLVCGLRTGASHKRTPGGQVSVTMSTDRGRTWSPYAVMASHPEGDSRNIALGAWDDETLVLAYGTFMPSDKGAYYVRSIDGGKTWSSPTRIELGLHEPWLHPFGQILRTADDRMVFAMRGAYTPAYLNRHPGLPAREAYLCWMDAGGLDVAEVTYQGPRSESSLLPLDGQEWLCYSRVNGARPQLGRSHDGGSTWGEWEDAYPHLSYSGNMETYAAPATMLSLPSGLMAIVHSFRVDPFGLRAVVSRDGGRTFDWERQYVLEDRYWGWDCGYPSTVCFSDGTMVTVAYALFDMAHPEWGTCAIAYVYHESLFEL